MYLIAPDAFKHFKDFLVTKAGLSGSAKDNVLAATKSRIYQDAQKARILPSQLAEWMAEFLTLPFFGTVAQSRIQLGFLPNQFSKEHRILPLSGEVQTFAVANPFVWERLRLTNEILFKQSRCTLVISTPEAIDQALAKVEQAQPGKTEENPLSVLVVEDDHDCAMLVERILRGTGFEVTRVDNGEDARHQVERQSFDLILTDINMPVMNGFELLARLKEKELSTPVLLLTARHDPETEERCRDLGAAGVIHKPFSKKDLTEYIQSVLDEG